jgi:flagellar FliL protein
MPPPAKTEPAVKAEAKSDTKAEIVAPAAAPVARGGFAAWLPVIVTLLLAPVATWAAVEFVVLPRLQKKIAAGPASAAAGTESPAPEGRAAESGKGKKEGKEGKEGGAGPNYQFENVLVNIAGTMGTRYLKVSFLVTGVDPNIKSIFEGAKPRLTDITLNVLSSLTLADLEEPGAKNVIREKLVNAYNQALGKKVADQVYFSDFVIQ